MQRILANVVQDEAKDKLIQGSWIAFQMGAGGDKKFGEYLDSIGLGKTEGQPQQKRTAKEIIANVEATLREEAKKHGKEKEGHKKE